MRRGSACKSPERQPGFEPVCEPDRRNIIEIRRKRKNTGSHPYSIEVGITSPKEALNEAFSLAVGLKSLSGNMDAGSSV